MAEPSNRRDEAKRSLSLQPGSRLIRREAKGRLAVRLRGSTGTLRHTNLVDDRSQHCFREARGRLRERPQGLPEEADSAAERSHHAARRRADRKRSTEDHDDLYDRRTREGRRRKVDSIEGRERVEFSLAIAA